MKPIKTQQILHKLHKDSFIHPSEDSLVCIPLQEKYVLYLEQAELQIPTQYTHDYGRFKRLGGNNIVVCGDAGNDESFVEVQRGQEFKT